MYSAMTPVQSPTQNHLLAALPPADFEAIGPQLELVPMALGQMLYEPGTQLRHAYFPTDSIVSLHYVTENGASAETAGVGNEGMVGISLFMGGDTTSSSAVVQTAGTRLPARPPGLAARVQSRPPVPKSAAALHPGAYDPNGTDGGVQTGTIRVEQQLCRWLLLTLDRVPTRDLTMTQELVASMLGVRRESVTDAAGRLQAAGFIRYRRGHIGVLGPRRPGAPGLRMLRGRQTGAPTAPARQLNDQQKALQCTSHYRAFFKPPRGPSPHQGRIAISLRTATTPLTPRAMVSAMFFSVAFLAKPDNITVPFMVSTLIAAASTCLLSTMRAFTMVRYA